MNACHKSKLSNDDTIFQIFFFFFWFSDSCFTALWQKTTQMSSLLPVSWIFCFLLCLWTLPSGSSSTIKQVANDVSSAPQRLRHLAVGDFQELNEIIQDATIELPETSASGNMYSLRLYSIRCTDFSIGDVHLSSHQSSHTQIMLGMEITDFSMTCRARYHFTGFLVNNRGDVEVTSLGNDAVVIGKVLSTNLYEDPPTTVEIYKCDPTVNLNGMNFINGGIWGVLLNTAEGLLKRIMEPILEQRICSELQAIMLDVEVFLEYAKEILDEYDPQNSPVTDPLLSELIMNVPSSIQLLTLQDDVSRFGKLFQAGVEQAVEYMQAVVPDLANPSQFDLQANILLREYLLEDGALVIDLANDFSNIAILLQDHNTLTYTIIRLDSVRLVGLDTLTKFHPLDTIGSYTLKTQLSWEYLAFEMLATIEVKPSTLPDSIISGSGNTRILEKVNIFFGIDDLFADVSLLSALDQDALENIRLGSLLQKTNIMTCLLSSIFKMELSAFSVQANNILTPTMDGFVSTGLDRVFSEAMEATFKMYENILLNASPAYFQRTIRPMLNQRLLQDYIDDSQCADPVGLIRSPNKEKPIDFRDLLLPPDEALDAGATGQEPYGNLFSSFVIPELQEQFLQRANHFNQRFIRPLTLKQSGIEGTVQWEPDLLSYSDASWPDLYDRFEFSLSNLRVANLDTVMDPIKILEPNDKNILFNSIRLDSNEEKETLNLTMTLSILIDGDESPLQMENHLDISISIPATSLSLGIMTSIKEYSLLAFPLNDVTNIFCWLAAFGDLDANGDWVHSLDISSLSFWISSFFLDSTCLKCTSPGGGAFSEVLSEINRLVGSNQRLRNKIIHLVESMAWSLWNQFDMESLLADAPKYCPHLPDYDPESAFLTYQWPIVSSLPTEAMESILMLGAIAFQALLIVTAKNHLLADNHDNVFRMKKKRDLFDISGDAWVVDWTNLANDYGSWVEFAFEEFRTYLGEPVKERVLKKDSGMTIRANSLLREYVLDENAAYNMDLGVYGLNYETMGFAFSAHSLLIHGLDSITSLDVFIPKGPQTLENHFRLEKIQLQFQIKITTPEGRTDYMSLTYMVRDIVGQVDLDVVVDLQRLGDIQLGSIFNLDQILFCALSGLQSFQFSALRLSIGSLEYPLIEGFLSSENQEFLMWMMGSLVDKYRDDLVAAIPLIFGQTIRDIANALSAQIIGSMSKKCSLPEGYPETGMVDWRDFLLSSTASRFLGGSGAAPYGNLFSTIYDMVNEKIFRLGASNRPLINDLLRKVTERQSNVTGSILFRGKALESSASISLAGLTADIGLSLSDVAIDHLDSVGDPLDLFRPIDRKSNILKSVASFGVDSKPLSLTGTIILTLADGGKYYLPIPWN